MEGARRLLQIKRDLRTRTTKLLYGICLSPDSIETNCQMTFSDNWRSLIVERLSHNIRNSDRYGSKTVIILCLYFKRKILKDV